MAFRIYTKTGDAGETGLVGGSRVSKGHERVEALGDVDELNAVIGLARCRPSSIEPWLAIIQDELFQVGSEVASIPGARLSFQLLESGSITRLEEWIDEATAQLPPLKSFILPGGSELSALLHLARATCRRAERSVIRLSQNSEVRNEILIYLNRLSDWLFVAARKANAEAGVEDTMWTPRGS